MSVEGLPITGNLCALAPPPATAGLREDALMGVEEFRALVPSWAGLSDASVAGMVEALVCIAECAVAAACCDLAGDC